MFDNFAFDDVIHHDQLDVKTRELLPYIGYPRTLNAMQSLNEILPE